jgi:hypothetical protein
MNVTTVRADGELQQIFFGKPTQELKNWVEQMNENPLNNKGDWTVDEEYTEVSLYQLAEFLKIKYHESAY